MNVKCTEFHSLMWWTYYLGNIAKRTVYSGINEKEKCQVFKDKGMYYFTHQDYLQNKRNRNIMNIPMERRKIRPNVESLMKELKARAPGGKAKVRGLFKKGPQLM